MHSDGSAQPPVRPSATTPLSAPADPFLNPRSSSRGALSSRPSSSAVVELSESPIVDVAAAALSPLHRERTASRDTAASCLTEPQGASSTAAPPKSTATATALNTSKRTRARSSVRDAAEAAAPSTQAPARARPSPSRGHATALSRPSGGRGGATAPLRKSSNSSSLVAPHDDNEAESEDDDIRELNESVAERAISDDDGEGDAEEKALAAVTGAAQGSSATSTAAPHPWLVTDAFHVSLWYVLRNAGNALSASDLWAARALLSLTAVATLQDRRAGGVADSEHRRTSGEAALTTPPQPEPRTWAGTEESELLLRLVLRKPHGFTARHLELRYGEWLHVQPTLDALTQRRFLWWPAPRGILAAAQKTANADADSRRPERGEAPDRLPADRPPMSPCPMLECYDGARIADLLLSRQVEAHDNLAGRGVGTSGGDRAELTPTMELLQRVLQAVRGIELRLFLTALRHASKACAATDAAGAATSIKAASQAHTSVQGSRGDDTATRASNGAGGASKYAPLGDNSLYDAIPGRKRDMIRYFLERRYSLWSPSPASPAHNLTAAPFAKAAAKDSKATKLPPPSHKRRLPTQPTTPAAATQRCFATLSEEAHTVARCWNTHVGTVYAPHAELKAHLVWLTELFHVLTSNNGSGAVGHQSAAPLAATMAVAAPPTLLMVRPQLLLLLQSLRVARQQRACASVKDGVAVPNVEEGAEQGPPRTSTSDTFLASVPHALLPRWFSPPVAVTSTAAALRSPGRPQVGDGEHVECASTLCEPDASSTKDLKLQSLDDDDVMCSARSFHSFDVDEEGNATYSLDPGLPPPMHLFASPAVLQEYRAALYVHRALYNVTDGAITAAQRFRGRSAEFVSHMYETVISAVRTGVAVVKQHPSKRVLSSAAAKAAERFTGANVPCISADPTAPISLESILYSRGQHAEHLLMFTPLFRWFACLEVVFPLLQSVRRYDDANECLRYLLFEPIFVLHHMPDASQQLAESSLTARDSSAKAVSPVTFAFRYKVHKRGEWLTRLAQNMSHQKHNAEALKVLEEAQAGYHELDGQSFTASAAVAHAPMWLPCNGVDNPVAAALCATLAGVSGSESELPIKVQRRGRMLRVLWPAASTPAATVISLTGVTRQDTSNEESSINKGASPSVPLALYHAVWEYVRERYCRRHDRLQMERSLTMMHRRVRQWTPLAAHRELATRQLIEVAVRRVNGVRDAMDRMLWREPSGLSRKGPARRDAAGPKTGEASHGARRPATGVELFVMHHFLNKWNHTSTAAGQTSPMSEDTRDEGLQRRSKVPRVEDAKCHAPNRSRTEWRGAHCEGQWIVCLAHALLWDCYWAYPSVSLEQGHEKPLESVQMQDCSPAQREVLWLSAFQDGPLDVMTPIHFLLRRRSLIEARLSQLEQCSREQLLSYVAARIKADPIDTEPVAHAAPRQDGTPQSGSEEEGEEGDLAGDEKGCEETGHQTHEPTFSHATAVHEGRSVSSPFPDSTFDRAEQREPRGIHNAGSNDVSDSRRNAEEDSVVSMPTPAAAPTTEAVNAHHCRHREDSSADANAEVATHSTGQHSTPRGLSLQEDTTLIPEAWKVPVGQLPLLDILRAAPLAPLWRLLRSLYLSPVTEGVPLRYSGFPDLLFWQQSCGGDRDEADKMSAHSAPMDDTDALPTISLMEVKSPSDFLSTKQIAVNDLLHRCGFEVCVVRVDEVYDDGQPVSSKKLR